MMNQSRSIKTVIAMLALVGLSVPTFSSGCKKKQQVPPSLGDAARIESIYDKASSTLSVQVELPEGLHAYALGETIGRPVSLAVSPENGWVVDGNVEAPKGKEKILKLGKSVILEGSFSLKAKVKGGSGPLKGELHLQVCSDDACDRPRTHPFEVDVPQEKL